MNQVLNRQIFDTAEPTDGRLSATALDQLFRQARTHNGWLDQPVPHALLEEAVELAKLGPTAVNASPFRVVFVETPEAKARLKPALSAGNLDKTMAAPVTAIVAHDLAFYDHLPRLFPHADVRPMFADNEAVATHTAVQNGTLQLAYFILALRALGLDTGPMGGFDKDKVDAEFFAGTKTRSNVLVNIGYGDHTKLFPRSPRLAFHEIAAYA
jgi:3-hydroxypropanoate dehydrogenase